MVNTTTLMCVCTIGILAFVVVNALRELVQVYQQKLHYLFEMNNIVSWFLYISATIMVSPLFTGGYITDLHYSAASITVFLSWFNLLLFLQRFDQVRKYLQNNIFYVHFIFLHIFYRLVSMWSCFSRSCRP